MLPDSKDAFGHAMLDYFHGKNAHEIIERDDGMFDYSGGPALYFSPPEEWPEIERQALDRYAHGRVLDIGSGAGRHALYLQDKGLEVVGVDNSPNALETARLRGLRQTVGASLTQLSARRLGTFDTIIMLGNNFCLVGTPQRAKWILRRLAGMLNPGGCLLAESRCPYPTTQLEHLEYHARNRARGRLAGQARIRVHYKKFTSPWIGFLMVTPEEMETLLEDTPWRVTERLDSPLGIYIAILNGLK